jgi:hypothetical protein
VENSSPVLVTGAHRSGTTWIGKILAADPGFAYISEPLNVLHRHGVMRIPTQQWYTYICEDNQQKYKSAFQEMIDFQYHSWMEIKSLRSVKDFLRMVRDWWDFRNGRQKQQTPLIKDPFAIFSTEWFAKCLGCRVVIVVRHPAAVVSSLVRLGWNFDFNDFLEQQYLMRDWLEPFKGDMEETLKSPNDVIAQGSLLWRMVHQVVANLQNNHPEFTVIRHEDVSSDPLNKFQKIYSDLGMDFSKSVRKIISDSSRSENPKEISQQDVHSIYLDSQANIKNWQQRLSESDIGRVRHLTRDVAPVFYSEEDWR